MTSPLVGIACGLLLKGQNIANIVEGEPTTKEEFESSYREQIGTDGDMAIMAYGGHSYKILEDNTKIIETKNGPFISVDVDKVKYI